MTSVSAKASVISRRGRSLSGAIVSTIAALVVASGAAAWIADFDPAAFVSQPVPFKDNSRLTFGDRFSLGSTARSTIKDADPLSLDQSVIREFNIKIQEAKVRLAQKLQSSEWRTALITVPTPSTVSAVPLPKSRPVEATLDSRGRLSCDSARRPDAATEVFQSTPAGACIVGSR